MLSAGVTLGPDRTVGTRRAALLVLALMGAVVALAAARPRTPRPGDFIPVEYAPYDSAGTGEIAGFGAALPPGGFYRTIAGQTVVLSPVTGYAQRWWDRWLSDELPMDRPDARATAYLRSVMADSTGHFRFEHLPAGEYFVRTVIGWDPTGEVGNFPRLRVLMGKRLALGPGEKASVVLDSLRADERAESPNWEVPAQPARPKLGKSP